MLRILDPIFSFPDPGSRVDKIPDPDLQVFLTQKTYTNLPSSQKLDPVCSMFIPDPCPEFFSISDPDPGVKKHRIPYPGSGSATLIDLYFFVDFHTSKRQERSLARREIQLFLIIFIFWHSWILIHRSDCPDPEHWCKQKIKSYLSVGTHGSAHHPPFPYNTEILYVRYCYIATVP